jgi:hypothetical protein
VWGLAVRRLGVRRLGVLQEDNNRDGHSTTDTAAWFNQAAGDAVRPLECFKSNR